MRTLIRGSGRLGDDEVGMKGYQEKYKEDALQEEAGDGGVG